MMTRHALLVSSAAILMMWAVLVSSKEAAHAAVPDGKNTTVGKKNPDWIKQGRIPSDAECGFSNPKVSRTPVNTPESIRRAIEDLIQSCGSKYPKGNEYLERLEALDPKDKAGLEKLQREALLANPLLDFDKLLLVKRGGGDGLVQNWQSLNSLKKRTGYDSEIMVLEGLDNGQLKTIYKSSGGKYVGQIDLHFDAGKMLFSSIAGNGTFAVFEVGVDGKHLRQVSPDMGQDVDNFDACYLPNGKIIFNSTSGYTGVPCVGGKDHVANLHLMDSSGKNVRRLCFEQDSDWHPNVMPNGRVMYLRWEYTDTPHYVTRVLMTMNPDGTDQKAYYGSNSYWPNSLFYARPCPGSPNKFVGIVSGHHGIKRSGPLVLFDVSTSRFEADGAAQLVPGYGKKVEAITTDGLASSYPDRCLHPYPLSDKYFLISKMGKICLVDVFDNQVQLLSSSDLYEPIPLRATKKPPVIPDRTIAGEQEATVMLSDIYVGPGLAGVPRGTVKSIRVFRYEYGPRGRGGHAIFGKESGWDAKLTLGTVPVDPDGSASFKIPANTPISLQPLDEDGKALALMRSWFVGMPGENLACVGCHENANMATPTGTSSALRRQPETIKPWYGPTRGFSFIREVLPVLDKYCVDCHDKGTTDGKKGPRLSHPAIAYKSLIPFVRRGGPEGDYHLLTPLEYHADTSELVQMLEKGHHNVKLDPESWDRIITWIDLNAPERGTWTEAGANKKTLERRFELRKLYAGVAFDTEVIYNPYVRQKDVYVEPEPLERDVRDVKVAGWPFNASAAKKLQGDGQLDFAIAEQFPITFVRIPAGSFAMGSNDETPVEQPVTEVKIEKPFYMSTTEVTLGQYRLFDPNHENGVYDRLKKDQSRRGYYMNNDYFPVVRVSWSQAMQYCEWLSRELGTKVTLPTESQWEWACRGGTATPFSFGKLDASSNRFANLADKSLESLSIVVAVDSSIDDGVMHLAPIGRYQPNAFGLHDMHGNAAEWTRSDYKAYPYNDRDGRNNTSANATKSVRGGSWHDRRLRSTSSYRLGYPAWQRPYNTGFRVIIED